MAIIRTETTRDGQHTYLECAGCGDQYYPGVRIMLDSRERGFPHYHTRGPSFYEGKPYAASARPRDDAREWADQHRTCSQPQVKAEARDGFVVVDRRRVA